MMKHKATPGAGQDLCHINSAWRAFLLEGSLEGRRGSLVCIYLIMQAKSETSTLSCGSRPWKILEAIEVVIPDEANRWLVHTPGMARYALVDIIKTLDIDLRR